jgi:hypothetical protein
MKTFEITPIWTDVPRYADAEHIDRVYNLVHFITDNRNTATEALNWCKSARVGDTYKHADFQIKVIED